MPEQPAGSGRPQSGRAARKPHHISAIAHLFFADEQVAADGPVRLAVAGLGATRAAAFACAGLVAGCRHLTGDRDGRRVTLHENADLTWSAAAYLAPAPPPARDDRYPGSARRTPPDPASPPTGRGSQVHWDHLGPLAPSDLGRLERWRGALEAGPTDVRSVPRPGRDGVVLCLDRAEMGKWTTAFTLGRLLGLLRPRRLELLLFPDSWRGGGGATAAARADSTERWLRRLTRAVQPDCVVHLTGGLPELGRDAARTAGPLLEDVAGRLLADFGVDRAD